MAESNSRVVSSETKQRQASARLSLRQQRFVKEYAEIGNASEAVRRSGYSTRSPAVVKQQASENLAKPYLQSAIKQELARIEADYGPDRVKRRLDQISHASEAAGQFGPAVRSEELLGKAAGMWVDQSIALTGVMSDSHVAALLELARKRQQEPIDLIDDQNPRSNSSQSENEDR